MLYGFHFASHTVPHVSLQAQARLRGYIGVREHFWFYQSPQAAMPTNRAPLPFSERVLLAIPWRSVSGIMTSTHASPRNVSREPFPQSYLSECQVQKGRSPEAWGGGGKSPGCRGTSSVSGKTS